MQDLENFIKENIVNFNERPNSFKNAKFNDTQIKNFLQNRFAKLCDDSKIKK